jgi:riboflavin transporter FmnP
MIAFMGALSFGLMMLKLPVKYLGFLEVEFSDIPAVVCGFAYGPVAGILVELIKNVIKAITASSTGGVGEIANFVVSVGFVLPSSLIYRKIKNKVVMRDILTGLTGTLGLCIMGIIINYYVTVPLYAKLLGGMDKIVGVCQSTIPIIDTMAKVIIIGITPFNIVKGIVISILSLIIYRSVRKAL